MFSEKNQHYLGNSGTNFSHRSRLVSISVIRSGDLLHFTQIFKACGNNYFAQIANKF